MECLDCDKIVELNKQSKSLSYIRVDKVGILISACDKHFNMVRKLINGSSGTVYRMDNIKTNFEEHKKDCEFCKGIEN